MNIIIEYFLFCIVIFFFNYLLFEVLLRYFISYLKEKYCKKNNGACENYTCWSCPRKLYIDEYKMKEREDNENKNV